MRFIFTVIFSLSFITFAIFLTIYTWELKQSGSSLGGPIDVEQFNHNIRVLWKLIIKYIKVLIVGETFTQMGINVPQSNRDKMCNS